MDQKKRRIEELKRTIKHLDDQIAEVDALLNPAQTESQMELADQKEPATE